LSELEEAALERVKRGQAHLQPVVEVTPQFLSRRLLEGLAIIQSRLNGLDYEDLTEEARERNKQEERKNLEMVEEHLHELRERYGEQLSHE
jgi:hypothetical protein